jgi:hypothetical protein
MLLLLFEAPLQALQSKIMTALEVLTRTLLLLPRVLSLA